MTRRVTEALTPERYRAEAGPARSRIVDRVDGTHHFFTIAASARVILFPVRYALDERQFEALTSAAVSIDEGDGFYVHMIERATEPDPERVEDWWISFSDYETYFKDVPPLENLVHSPNGSWALLALQDDSAAVGGTERFIDALLDHWPAHVDERTIYGPRRQVEAYLAQLAWVGIADVVLAWLPAYLEHIYGQQAADRLLSVYDGLRRDS